MSCTFETVTPYYVIESKVGDKITIRANIAKNGVYGLDLSAYTPQVEINTAPATVATYDQSGMTSGILLIFFTTEKTSPIAPGRYEIGGRLIDADSEPHTFLELGLNLEAAVVS